MILDTKSTNFTSLLRLNFNCKGNYISNENKR